MDITLIGLIVALCADIAAVAYWGGKLAKGQKVLEEKFEKGFTCPMHDHVQEQVVRIEERANVAKEIAIAVAAAKKDWERDLGK